jgi:hypothetical protein
LEEKAMNERPGYGDAEAKRIIERAAEIDAKQGHQLDAPALREIAAEAGISRLAFDQALQEHESTPIARVSWLKRHPALVAIAAIVAALLFIVFTRLVVPPPL